MMVWLGCACSETRSWSLPSAELASLPTRDTCRGGRVANAPGCKSGAPTGLRWFESIPLHQIETLSRLEPATLVRAQG